jgi:hypothetical protein
MGAAGLRGFNTPDAATRMAGVAPGTEAWQEFLGLLRSRGVVIDPTLAIQRSVGRTPPDWVAAVLNRFPPQARRRLLDAAPPVPPPFRERWEEIVANGSRLVRALHEAAVQIVAGTDLRGGLGLHRELELYQEAGIPAIDVLAIATLGAARVTGRDAEFGSVEPGKFADLIVVDGDPTTDISDIRRIVLVLKGGDVYDPAAIYRALCSVRQ